MYYIKYIPVIAKLNFPVFSVTWSFKNHKICWFVAQARFLLIINFENSCVDLYFCGNCDIV